jgi:hypothetical protein
MAEAGQQVPAPSRLDDLPCPIEPDISEVARLLVRLEVRERRRPEHRAAADVAADGPED